MCKELDFKAEEKIPFSVLSQHPFLQDLIEASSQYLLVVSVAFASTYMCDM